MNPQAYAIFDANGVFLASVVVNHSTPNYVNVLEALTDGNGTTPLKTGNQMSVGVGPTGVVSLVFTLPPGTNTPETQWVVSDDVILNTPHWPDLTLKYGWVVKPFAVNANGWTPPALLP